MKKNAKVIKRSNATQGQKDTANEIFTRFKSVLTELNCVHYCSSGGHLWFHSPRPVTLSILPDCPYRMGEEIKFFVTCKEHK
jgi:hypothetical protein